MHLGVEREQSPGVHEEERQEQEEQKALEASWAAMTDDQGDQKQVNQRSCGEANHAGVEEIGQLWMQPVQKFYRANRK